MTGLAPKRQRNLQLEASNSSAARLSTTACTAAKQHTLGSNSPGAFHILKFPRRPLLGSSMNKAANLHSRKLKSLQGRGRGPTIKIRPFMPLLLSKGNPTIAPCISDDCDAANCWPIWCILLRASANRLVTFRTCFFITRSIRRFATFWNIRYSPIGGASYILWPIFGP